ncbi:hypothetical protein Baya_6049 [Bagarius yarrelli]|uniref:Uncharacterized protein n=1 Tax=Bagarius yarrelli TaxID=175774 RepID=A0A556U0Y3_BAGYA|nr:hypothetical protein Baya_6049 [Bagarius yarrelli]
MVTDDSAVSSLSWDALCLFLQQIDECTAGALSDHSLPPPDVFILVNHRHHQTCPTSLAGCFPREETKKSAGKKLPLVLQMLCVRRQASGLYAARFILLLLVDGFAPRCEDNASNCECTLTTRQSGLLGDACVQIKPANWCEVDIKPYAKLDMTGNSRAEHRDQQLDSAADPGKQGERLSSCLIARINEMLSCATVSLNAHITALHSHLGVAGDWGGGYKSQHLALVLNTHIHPSRNSYQTPVILLQPDDDDDDDDTVHRL